MTPDNLKNKPLVEAIFELRWELQELESGFRVDPSYQLLVGILFDRLSKDYPFSEQVFSTSILDAMIGRLVQYRFRKGKDQWPLVQIGPGILTLNATEDYIWNDFEKRVFNVVNTFYQVYPKSENLIPVSILLKYIDAIDIDFNNKNQDLFAFLNENLKINFSLDKSLYEQTSISSNPVSLDCNLSFKCNKPNGVLNFRFVTGKNHDKNVLILETVVQSYGDNMPDLPLKLREWLEDAHNVAHSWFFNLMNDDLLKEFNS